MRKYILPVAAAAVLASAASAFAASSPGNFNVKVNITTACTVAATDVNFGNLATVVGTETATSTVTVACNPGTAYSLSFTNTAGTLTKTDTLVNGANTIGYDLSLGTAAAASGTSAGTHNIDVVLQASAFPATGLYQDTQTVNVVY